MRIKSRFITIDMEGNEVNDGYCKKWDCEECEHYKGRPAWEQCGKKYQRVELFDDMYDFMRKYHETDHKNVGYDAVEVDEYLENADEDGLFVFDSSELGEALDSVRRISKDYIVATVVFQNFSGNDLQFRCCSFVPSEIETEEECIYYLCGTSDSYTGHECYISGYEGEEYVSILMRREGDSYVGIYVVGRNTDVHGIVKADIRKQCDIFEADVLKTLEKQVKEAHDKIEHYKECSQNEIADIDRRLKMKEIERRVEEFREQLIKNKCPTAL
jgi:hypothetical protein